ncbi:MAG: hypothetical protein AB8G99_00610, partial [Planctomycetaceae bacterium]
MTIRILLMSLIAAAISSPIAAAQSAADRKLNIQRQVHARSQAAFEKEIDKIIEWCNERGMVEAAKRTRKQTRHPDPQALTQTPLPREKQAPIPESAIGDERLWYGKLSAARKEHARELYRLSRTVLRQGYPSYALELIQEVAYHDPDHKNARRILGFVDFHDKQRQETQYLGEWVTPFEKKMLAKKRIWSDKYGWIPELHLEKYEQGLRPFKASWITAEKDQQIRRDFRNAWVIETEHFKVKTNYSLERGVEIAAKLENFYSFFRRTFATFFETPEEFRNRFTNSKSSRGRMRTPRQMEVHYFRNKEEYVEKLVRNIQQIAITDGLYYEPDQTSYFYHDPARETEGTLYHEATHQFFDIPTIQHRNNAARQLARRLRTKATRWKIGERSNFWMVEAIACYMESFEPSKSGNQLGNPQYERFRAAHFRLTNTEYYVPLRQFSAMGMQQFQTSPKIAMNYTQGSGLAHFFMHYEGGRYRDSLVAFIGELYRPDITDPTR